MSDNLVILKGATKYRWTRLGIGYECSSRGDPRFSALFARMPDGRTIESFYQCDLKGYQPGGTDWKLGKGKPPLNPDTDLWQGYLKLWFIWASNNEALVTELEELVSHYNYTLKDSYAATPVNQARALAYVLAKREKI